ncbi:MAG TPA: hypothetical protein VIG45_01240 [Erysipelothrix sp.]
MDVFNVRALTQKQRFTVAIIVGLLSSIILGVLTGLIRSEINISIIVWGVGYGVAMAIQKFGRGVQKKFAILGVLFTLLGIVISDVVYTFGLSNLLDMSSYLLVIKLSLSEDVSSMIWLLHRFIALYIGYNYSRII